VPLCDDVGDRIGIEDDGMVKRSVSHRRRGVEAGADHF
jgi:hypothetical protein